MRFTKDDLNGLLGQGKIRGFKAAGKEPAAAPQPVPAPPKKKAHKYAAEPKVVDGIKFPSTREANRYVVLKQMQDNGIICNLRRQVKFELNPGGTFSYIYIADFTYNIVASNELVVEDSKGFKTREYKKKKKLMLKVHEIEVKET